MTRVLLERCRIFDGTGSDAIADAAVLIEGPDIVAAGRGIGIPSSATRVDLGGATVMPGIVNGTDYLTMKQVTQAYYDVYRQSSHLQLLRCVRSALVLLAQGVTTTVDIGAIERVNVHLRNGIALGILVGPRIVTSGTPIEPRLTTEGVKTPGMTVDAYDADEVRRHAEALVAADVDFLTVKIDRRDFKSGQTRSFTVKEVRAAREVATAAGKRMHVLAREPGDIRTAIDAGADSISPAMGLAREPGLAKDMAARGIFFVSSVSSWPRGPMASPERDREHRESLRHMLEAGVRVVPGIDLYGTSPVDELVALGELGVRPTAALAAATSVGAAMVGLGDRAGVVATGRRADLVTIDGDPTRDLTALGRVRDVYLGGVRYGAADVDRLVGGSTTIDESQPAKAGAR